MLEFKQLHKSIAEEPDPLDNTRRFVFARQFREKDQGHYHT
jgi:hypothetical protein